MKMKLIAGIFCILILAGCGPQKPDPKIAELEKRVAELEAQIKGHEKFENDLATLVSADYDSLTNYNSIQDLRMQIQQIDIGRLQRNFSNLIDIKYGWQPVPNIKGIPIPAYNQIVARAAQEWPNDYEMQLSRINNEVDAYKKLHAISAK